MPIPLTKNTEPSTFVKTVEESHLYTKKMKTLIVTLNLSNPFHLINRIVYNRFIDSHQSIHAYKTSQIQYSPKSTYTSPNAPSPPHILLPAFLTLQTIQLHS
jgi:hypothetical protein